MPGDDEKKGYGRATRRHHEFESDELHWYAIDVARQKEYVAGFLFNRMECMTFIPTEMRFRKKNRYAKGKIEVAFAAIPGVVFVGFVGTPNWYRVMSMHLVNGVLSTDGRARRIDPTSKDWLHYRAHQLDGQLVIERHKVLFKGQEVERSAALVQVQGRGVIRSPWSLKNKAGGDRPIVIRVAGERGRIMKVLFGAPEQEGLEAAAALHQFEIRPMLIVPVARRG